MSMGGREILIKSVLQAVLMFDMSCFMVLRSFCRELESMMARFWWQNSDGRKGIY